MRLEMYKHFFKRLIDIVLSFIGIVVLALPMLIIGIIIKIDSPGPVLFKQKRIGIHKKTFTILKFRSMPISAPHDTPTHQLQNAEAMLSGFQRFIRKSSIDELPQLFCIFIGKMSIIGERGIIETTKKNADFSRAVTGNSISLWGFVRGWKRRQTAFEKSKWLLDCLFWPNLISAQNLIRRLN